MALFPLRVLVAVDQARVRGLRSGTGRGMLVEVREGQASYDPPEIEGWMTPAELAWLYERALEMRTIIEVGCYQGRSTHALLSADTAHVWAVDHFLGSQGPDAELHLAARGDSDGIYRAFVNNTAQFLNLSIIRLQSLEAAAVFADNAVDMVFLDAGHLYDEVKADILAWRPKARRLLCGHDYDAQAWPDVVRAVDETVGPVEVAGTIWWTKTSSSSQ